MIPFSRKSTCPLPLNYKYFKGRMPLIALACALST
jgi:hypothetical protein